MQFVAQADPASAAFLSIMPAFADASLAEVPSPPLLGRLFLDLRPQRQRGRWALQLDAAVAAAPRRTVAVAQGLACLALTYWAQLTPPQYYSNLVGAVLIAPARPVQAKDYAFAEAPHTRLPFPTLLATDPADEDDSIHSLATLWGSELISFARLEQGNWPWLEHASHLPIGVV